MKRAKKAKRMKAKAYWGGFTQGKLDIWPIEDGFGGGVLAAVFTSREQARKRYEDVRPVSVTVRSKRKAVK